MPAAQTHPAENSRAKLDQPGSPSHPAPIFGRGANLNPPNRFEPIYLSPDPDFPPDEQPSPRTQFFEDGTESLLTKNNSPDVGFSYGLNVYRGCEHGCAYCFARPYHEYLGWSSGLDFETKILVKKRAPELLGASCRRDAGNRNPSQ